MAKAKKYIISACLIGKNCCYDGGSRHQAVIRGLFDNQEAIALCPEELGGLKVPRPPCEIFAGNAEDVLKGKAYIFNREGKDVTINIIKGCREFVRMARECAVKKAILKARSPCCGLGKIYDGTFTGKLRKGNGVAAELLLKDGVDVITDEEYLKYNKKIINKRVGPGKNRNAQNKKRKR